MLGNCCNSPALLLGIFVLTTEITPLQPRIVVEDYDNDKYQNGYSEYRNGNDGYQNDNNGYQNGNDRYQNSNNGYLDGNDGYQNGKSGYQNGDNGYQNVNDGYQNGNNGYQNVNDGYQNGNNGYQNGNDGYQNANDGYQNGKSGYQNGNDGYQNGKSGYQNGNSGYQNGDNGYQTGYSGRQNAYSNYQNYQPPVKFDRPIVVKPVEKPKNQQDFSKIPGVPGVDYPLYHTVPKTSFSCAYVPFVPGMYANVETGCQAYHICHDGREGHQGASFLCTNGTVFNQREFACDWWYNVNCAEAPVLYSINLDPEKNPYIPKKPKKTPREGLRIAVF